MCDYPHCPYSFSLARGVVSYFVGGVLVDEVRTYCRHHVSLLSRLGDAFEHPARGWDDFYSAGLDALGAKFN